MTREGGEQCHTIMNANGLTLLFRSHTTGNDSPADLGDKEYNQYFVRQRNDNGVCGRKKILIIKTATGSPSRQQ
jgi:hypothetical protein